MSKKRKKSSRIKWRDKADGLITEMYTGRKCVVCWFLGSKHNTYTVGHHLIERARGLFRHDPMNLLPLCPEHHIFSNDIAPHSGSILAVRRFLKFLEKYLPKHYAFLIDNEYKGIGQKVDFEVAYNRFNSYEDKEIDDIIWER